MRPLYFVLSLLVGLASFAPSVFGAHEKTIVHEDVAYLLHADPNSIARYDMTNELWLQSIELPLADSATGLELSGDRLLVAFGSNVYSYALDGTDATLVWSQAENISGIASTNGYLFISASDRLANIVSLENFALTQSYTGFGLNYLRTGLSASNSLSRIFGRSTGLSPADIGYLEIDSNGMVVSSGDSPHHGSYPSASHTYVFPDGSRVVDDQGIIYNAQSLSYLGSFAGAFLDILFIGDLPIILREGEITAYSNTLLPTGSAGVTVDGERALAALDNNIFVFGGSGANYNVQKIQLSEFSSASPNDPVDPIGLSYTPDFYVLDEDDNALYLLSKLHTSVFVWSVDSGAYQESIPLQGAPEFMAMDTQSNILYLAYNSGEINKIDLSAETPTEQSLTALALAPLGLSTAGSYIFAVDAAGAWVSHYTFAQDGTPVSAEEWNYRSSEYIWNAANERMYFMRDDTSPNDILWEQIDPVTGVIGEKEDSPYHSSNPVAHPIRVAPNGGYLVLGTGRVFGGVSLVELANLGNSVKDAAWTNDSFMTLRSGPALLQFWDSNFSLIRELPLPENPQRIFGLGEQLLVVSDQEGIPTFEVMDIDNAADSDGDDVNNVFDNCPSVSNPTQTDTDEDGKGDACDEDIDNDGLSNELEEFYGLDPQDSSDALEDLDGDGFNNITEWNKGTDLNDAGSVPGPVTDIFIDFEDRNLPGYFEQTPESDGLWRVDGNIGYGNGSASLRAPLLQHGEQSSIVWTDTFVEGLLEFDARVEPDLCCGQLLLFVDGVQTRRIRYRTEWTHYSVELSSGVHTIEWRYEKIANPGQDADTAWIDNIRYYSESSADMDVDGVLDFQDNCISTPNPNQADTDGDGIGDACNNQFDRDADEWADTLDNCPNTQNPDQLNSDDDHFGDACDQFPTHTNNLEVCLLFGEIVRQVYWESRVEVSELEGEVLRLREEIERLNSLLE